ncbi:hypothetical protein [Amycolatopsis orientalis]|nr:hypothetical protein [Amycolatopsis orientalis]
MTHPGPRRAVRDQPRPGIRQAERADDRDGGAIGSFVAATAVAIGVGAIIQTSAVISTEIKFAVGLAVSRRKE